MLRNGNAAGWIRIILAFSLGVGSAVAATFTTFETQKAHDADQESNQQMMKEMRDDIKTLLQRVPAQPTIRKKPEAKPEYEGWGKPPRPRQQASN